MVIDTLIRIEEIISYEMMMMNSVIFEHEMEYYEACVISIVKHQEIPVSSVSKHVSDEMVSTVFSY